MAFDSLLARRHVAIFPTVWCSMCPASQAWSGAGKGLGGEFTMPATSRSSMATCGRSSLAISGRTSASSAARGPRLPLTCAMTGYSKRAPNAMMCRRGWQLSSPPNLIEQHRRRRLLGTAPKIWFERGHDEKLRGMFADAPQPIPLAPTAITPNEPMTAAW